MNDVTEIPTERGAIRVWQSSNQWRFATPTNEGQGRSFDDAVRMAFEDLKLNPSEYGY